MNISAWRIRNLSSLTMLIFGLLALLFGVVGLLSPATMLQAMNLQVLDMAQRTEGDYTLMFLTASSMASFNMGVYYILASLNNLKIFYRWTVPFRVVTFTVFTLAVMRGIAPSGFIAVGAWELIGAILTGLALWYESSRNIE